MFKSRANKIYLIGLYAIGECNFSDHGANRLGANSLLQASIDGYFILPNTINNYLANELKEKSISADHPEFVKVEQEVKDHISLYKSYLYSQAVNDARILICCIQVPL